MNQDKISADRQQAIDSIMTQAENEKKIADYKDAQAYRNYEYNLQTFGSPHWENKLYRNTLHDPPCLLG